MDLQFGNKIKVGNKEYIIIKYLGRGGFKIAYLGNDISTGEKVVIFKPIKNGEQYFYYEVNNLKKFGDKLKWKCIPGIICPIGLTNNTIVTNYFTGVDMFDYIVRKIKKRSYINSNVACKIIYNTLKTMDIFQNKLSMLHLDIKPENLRINEHLEVGIIDMGLACDFTIPNDCKIRGQGTPVYIPPEIYMYNNVFIDNLGKIDVWALGCVFFELLYLRHPLETLITKSSREKGDISNVMKTIFTTYGYYIEDIIKANMIRNTENIGKVIDFERIENGGELTNDVVLNSLNIIILKMLRVDPKKRISIRRATKYISEIYSWVSEHEEKELFDNLSEYSDIDASESGIEETSDIEMENTSDIDMEDVSSSNKDQNDSDLYKLSIPYKKNKETDDIVLEKQGSDWSDESNEMEDSKSNWSKSSVEKIKKPLINLYNWLKKKEKN